jgi:HK97 family phage portal protein
MLAMAWWPFRTPAVETKAATLADPDAELIELFTGVAPGNLALWGTGALHVPAVAAAVRVISEACATLDVFVERLAGERWEADETHPAAVLLHGQVNDWLSGMEFLRDLVAAALLNDAGGLAYVGRADGKPVELIHYKAGLITVTYEDTGEPRYRLGAAMLPARDVVHLRSAFSKSPVTLAREAIGAAREMERHAGNFFRKGARPGGVIQFPKDANVGPSNIGRIKAAWRAAHEGGENAGSTAVLYAGGTFNPLTMTSADAQFLEMRRYQVEEICRAFRVPPGLLYEMTRQTWSNMEQATREFLVFSLEPWLRSLEACLSRALIAPEDRGTVRIRFDRDDLTRASLTERATAINSLRASEVLSADEGRDWLGLPPRTDGGGGTYENPNITTRPADGQD